MTAAIVESATYLEGSVAELSLALSSGVAIASTVGQKTVRLHRRVDRHTIDRHE